MGVAIVAIVINNGAAGGDDVKSGEGGLGLICVDKAIDIANGSGVAEVGDCGFWIGVGDMIDCALEIVVNFGFDLGGLQVDQDFAGDVIVTCGTERGKNAAGIGHGAAAEGGGRCGCLFDTIET